MTKITLILYVVIFTLYVFFTRQPDFFDGEMTTGTIHLAKDSLFANFSVAEKTFNINVDYIFRKFSEGEKVQIIYDNQNPHNAALYSVWGYWIRWQEILMSLIFTIGMLQIAIQITKAPTSQALINELEGRKTSKKPKYNSDYFD